MAPMGVQKRLVGQIWNGIGHAARLEPVGGVGEQRLRNRVVQNRIGIGQRPLHLVEDHAVAGQLARGAPLLARKLEMPPLLLENSALLVNRRVKHRVEVHVHEVLEVLLVGRGDRVHGFVGKRHRVQEGLHRALQQIDERLLDGELARAAQNRVLEDVENAGVVRGGGFEGDGKRLVRIVVFQIQQSGAAYGMPHHVSLPVDLAQLRCRLKGETVPSGDIARAYLVDHLDLQPLDSPVQRSAFSVQRSAFSVQRSAALYPSVGRTCARPPAPLKQRTRSRALRTFALYVINLVTFEAYRRRDAATPCSIIDIYAFKTTIND